MLLKTLPIILSLIAGFVTCVASFLERYEGYGWLLNVLFMILLFYIIGLIARKILNTVLYIPEEENLEGENEDGEQEQDETAEEEKEAVNEK